MSFNKVRIGDTAVEFVANVVDENGDGVTGQTITVKLAEAGVTDSFLDFNDSTFKTSGWTTKTLTLVEDSSETGLYKVTWNSSTAITTEKRIVAVYEIASGGDYDGVLPETYLFHEESTVDGVLDAPLTDHETAGTMGAALLHLHSGSIGKIVYDETASTLTVYRWDDENTALQVFDVKGADGSAAGTDPHYERIPQ